jgi:hypothetical protein
LNSTQTLLNKRKNRAIAIILAYKEKECDQFLPEEQSQGLRKVVLDVLNDLSDFCADLLPQDVVWNEIYLERLASLHEMVSDIHRESVEGANDG